MEREIISFAKEVFKFREEDAGYFRLGDKWVVLANDMLVESTDVAGMTPEQVGFKAVTMSASDLASMGAKPKFFSYSIAFSKSHDMEFAKRVIEGISLATKRYGFSFLSGDTNEGKELIIDGIALGFAERLLLRSNAKPGDIVCLTGDVGRSFCGLLVVLGRYAVRGVDKEKLVRKFVEPIARVEEGVKLSKFANSCIDISDGLSKELNVVAEQSGVKIVVYEDRLPISKEVVEFCRTNGLDPVEVALNSGEEFELLFTLPRDKISALDFDFTVIGKVEEGEGVYLVGESVKRVEPGGWEHLTSHV